MYFWNINALVQKLKTNTLSTYEQAQYYFALVLCNTVQMGTSAIKRQPSLLSVNQNLLLILAGIIILIGGVLYCYRINKSGDNKEFLTRMICLTFTGSIRWAVFSLMIIVPVCIAISFVIVSYYSPTTIIDIMHKPGPVPLIGGAFGTIWAMSLYYYIGQQFYKVAH